MTWKATRALVTGGTRGIGEQLVRELVQRCLRVTATGWVGSVRIVVE